MTTFQCLVSFWEWRDRGIVPRVHIDVPMPLSYVTMPLVKELDRLEPFGKGNHRPVFADKNLRVRKKRVVGRSGNVLKLTLADAAGALYPAVYFGNTEEFVNFLEKKDTITLLHDAMLHSGQREESPKCRILRWGNYHLCKIFKDTGGEKGRNISWNLKPQKKQKKIPKSSWQL